METLRASLIFIVVLLCLPVFARAEETLETQIRVLYIITQTVGQICYTIDQEGRGSKTDLSLRAAGELNGGLARIASLKVEGASEFNSEKYQGVLRAELAGTINRSQDCKQAVFNTLVERMMPVAKGSATAASISTDSSGGDSSLNVVRDFYQALARADGEKAASLVIPEKRSSGPFSAPAISEFFSSLSEPLRLLRLSKISKSEYQVTYSYRAGNHACAGAALVYIVQRDNHPLIQRIKALQGC